MWRKEVMPERRKDFEGKKGSLGVYPWFPLYFDSKEMIKR